MNKTLVVLAAGIGSRYGGLKQMDPVGPSGEFIIDYSVYDALRAGFGRVLFVIRRDIEEAFRETVGSRLAAHIDVAYAYQELADLPAGFSVPPDRSKPWGTAHALLSCDGLIDGGFAVINADDFYGRHSYDVLSRFLDDTAADDRRHAMVAFLLRNTLSEHGHVARGICSVNAEGELLTVVERTKIEKGAAGILCDAQALAGDEPVSMNCWGFKASILAHLRDQFVDFLESPAADPKAEFFIPSVVNRLIERDEATVSVLETTSRWFGVTYRQERDAVVSAIRTLVEAGEYPATLWE